MVTIWSQKSMEKKIIDINPRYIVVKLHDIPPYIPQAMDLASSGSKGKRLWSDPKSIGMTGFFSIAN